MTHHSHYSETDNFILDGHYSPSLNDTPLWKTITLKHVNDTLFSAVLFYMSFYLRFDSIRRVWRYQREVIRIWNRWTDNTMAKRERTQGQNNYLQNTTHKRVSSCSTEGVSSSCSTSGTRRITVNYHVVWKSC